MCLAQNTHLQMPGAEHRKPCHRAVVPVADGAAQRLPRGRRIISATANRIRGRFGLGAIGAAETQRAAEIYFVFLINS